MDAKQLPQDATPTEGASLAKTEGGLPVPHASAVRVTREDLAQADKIAIDGLEVFANHGVYREENVLGQKFVVSLTLYTDLRRAGLHDDLDASIDYGAVCHLVDSYLREHTFKLIETAAEGVARELLGTYGSLLGVRVRVDKPWAPVGLPLASCGVEIVRTRA